MEINQEFESQFEKTAQKMADRIVYDITKSVNEIQNLFPEVTKEQALESLKVMLDLACKEVIVSLEKKKKSGSGM